MCMCIEKNWREKKREFLRRPEPMVGYKVVRKNGWGKWVSPFHNTFQWGQKAGAKYISTRNSHEPLSSEDKSGEVCLGLHLFLYEDDADNYIQYLMELTEVHDPYYYAVEKVQFYREDVVAVGGTHIAFPLFFPGNRFDPSRLYLDTVVVLKAMSTGSLYKEKSHEEKANKKEARTGQTHCTSCK